jgi:hypothetical protein
VANPIEQAARISGFPSAPRGYEKSNLNRSSHCEWFAEISSIAEASKIRLNPNSSRRITVHTLIVSNRESKFHLILR